MGVVLAAVGRRCAYGAAWSAWSRAILIRPQCGIGFNMEALPLSVRVTRTRALMYFLSDVIMIAEYYHPPRNLVNARCQTVYMPSYAFYHPLGISSRHHREPPLSSSRRVEAFPHSSVVSPLPPSGPRLRHTHIAAHIPIPTRSTLENAAQIITRSATMLPHHHHHHDASTYTTYTLYSAVHTENNKTAPVPFAKKHRPRIRTWG